MSKAKLPNVQIPISLFANYLTLYKMYVRTSCKWPHAHIYVAQPFNLYVDNTTTTLCCRLICHLSSHSAISVHIDEYRECKVMVFLQLVCAKYLLMIHVYFAMLAVKKDFRFLQSLILE